MNGPFTFEELRRAYDEGADMADRGFTTQPEEMDIGFEALLDHLARRRMREAAKRIAPSADRHTTPAHEDALWEVPDHCAGEKEARAPAGPEEWKPKIDDVIEWDDWEIGRIKYPVRGTVTWQDDESLRADDAEGRSWFLMVDSVRPAGPSGREGSGRDE